MKVHRRGSTLPIDLAPNGTAFDAKSIGNEYMRVDRRRSTLQNSSCQPNTAAIRRTAVREVWRFSRQHVGPIEGPPETPSTSPHYGVKGFKGS